MVTRSAALINEEPELTYARHGPPELVLIAGGGIGGLAAALALAKRGIAAHVLERRPAFAEDGAGIQIGPNGTKVLISLGVADLLRPRAAVPEAVRILDAATGRELARLPLGRWIAERHGAPYWVAHRQDLHAALLARARAEPLVRISAGAEITEAVSQAASVAASTGDGRTWTGDALVAADGLWSTLRTAVFDPARPRFAGKSAFRSVVPIAAVPGRLQRSETHLWLGPGAHIVHYPVRGGQEVAIVAILDELRATLDWSVAVDAVAIRDRARALFPDLRDLLSLPDTWRKWSLHTLSGGRALAHGRIALLGDAAHPVLPFLAQGGALALEDAVVLAHALQQAGGEVARGLRDYERRRRSRRLRVARASRLAGRIYHMSGTLASVRNALLSAAGPERMMAAYDWLYGWTE